MSTKNARTLGIRLDEKEATALQEIEDSTGLAPVSAVRIALKALIKRWQEKKRLILPFHVLGDDEFTDLQTKPQLHGLNAPKLGDPAPTPPAPIRVTYETPKRQKLSGGGSATILHEAADEFQKDHGTEGL